MTYVAIAQTENYQWVGFGATPNRAKCEVVDAFNATVNVTVSVARFEEMYGITTLPARAGTAYRDGEPVPPRRG